MFDEATFHDDADQDHHRDRKEDRQRNSPVDDRIAGRNAKDVMHIGHVYLQRVAEKVGLGFVDHRMAECQNARQGHSAESADHEQRAMGKVHNTKRAEDKCQTQRNQRIGRALVEPVQDLKDYSVHCPTL
mmetsp:Transcript_5235/g.5836  ORF Transcript_5235/g.5836 Transcript_5235/m.5836 type:complete len:130 (-) Transcript_5235:59-448(-)